MALIGIEAGDRLWRVGEEVLGALEIRAKIGEEEETLGATEEALEAREEVIMDSQILSWNKTMTVYHLNKVGVYCFLEHNRWEFLSFPCVLLIVFENKRVKQYFTYLDKADKILYSRWLIVVDMNCNGTLKLHIDWRQEQWVLWLLVCFPWPLDEESKSTNNGKNFLQ